MQRAKVDILELLKIIFLSDNHNEIILEASLLKSNRDIFLFCLELFNNGLVLLFGENGRCLMNNVSIDNLYEVRRKLMVAHINTKIVCYDKETALLVDLIVPSDNPKNVIESSLKEIHSLDPHSSLDQFKVNMLVNDTFVEISFVIE
tara:strand:- start:39461 stop:39901 length:441 start_codon:yes stop_codon:yes gene_type:complete